ncbi:MAG: FeoA family protein [Candidatus Roseilinea sp.]|uniref:FeoA family protein n=1 Tax=Candidatus Roseilinea sp. TaxID=2838777 RepID=UPI0040499840
MMPLSMTSPGADLRLMEIRGGAQLRQRLADLGLNPGTPVRVVHAGAGGMILDVKGSRLAIGFGMAMKILVDPEPVAGLQR